MDERTGSVFEALGERKRREILAVLADGERSAGAVVEAMQAAGPISQPAVSQHLKTLREAGLVTMRADGAQRIYAIDTEGIEGAIGWLSGIADPARAFTQPLDALATEVVRGKRRGRSGPGRTDRADRRDLGA